jgi:hypothetical protein
MALNRPPLSAFARFASKQQKVDKGAEHIFYFLLMILALPALFIFAQASSQRSWAQVQPRNS